MTLRFIILGFLNYGSMTGYDLKIMINKTVNFFWSAKLSQIYREFSEIKNLGYVSVRIEHQKGHPDKKKYSITEKGRAVFIEWLRDFPASLSSQIKSEFLVRIFFGANLNKEELILHFENYIKEQTKELKTYEVIDKELIEMYSNKKIDKEHFYQRLTLIRGLLYVKSEINWANQCIAEIKSYYSDDNNI